jgi:TrwC relaxase
MSAADTLAWAEDEAVVVYSGPGGTKWERPVGGLVVARFRHHDSRHRMPLLHDHLLVSVKVLRADGKWGHCRFPFPMSFSHERWLCVSRE